MEREQKPGGRKLFQKGRAKTGGRAKGTPNKITRTTKQALEAALEQLGGKEGATGVFKAAGKKDIVALASMASRALIPHELKAEVEQIGGLLPVRIIAVPHGMFITQDAAKQVWEHERPTPLIGAITSPKPDRDE